LIKRKFGRFELNWGYVKREEESRKERERDWERETYWREKDIGRLEERKLEKDIGRLEERGEKVV
jgi:hypothetical protein